MRAIFGLVGLLVVIGILYAVFHKVEAPILEEGHKAQERARDIGGQDAAAAIALEAHDEARPPYVLVTRVDAGSPWMTQYRLAAGDRILELDGLSMEALGDAAMGEKRVLDTLRGRRPMTIQRNGQRLTLTPGAGGAGGAGAGGVPGLPGIPTH